MYGDDSEIFIGSLFRENIEISKFKQWSNSNDNKDTSLKSVLKNNKF